MGCHFLLQWIMICQNSSLWLIHPGWPCVAWPIASLTYTGPFTITRLWYTNTGVVCLFPLQGIFLPQDWTCIPCVSCIGKWILYQLRHLGSADMVLAPPLFLKNIFFIDLGLYLCLLACWGCLLLCHSVCDIWGNVKNQGIPHHIIPWVLWFLANVFSSPFGILLYLLYLECPEFLHDRDSKDKAVYSIFLEANVSSF